MKAYQLLKKYLDDNGIKQEFIVSKDVMPANKLSLVLNGKRKLSTDEFIQIVKCLNITPNDIIFQNKEEIKKDIKSSLRN